MLPARVAVPVRDGSLVEVHARHVGTVLPVRRLQHLELHAAREPPPVALADLAPLHDSHASDPIPEQLRATA